MAQPREPATVFMNQPSFAAGEIAPELQGRVDQELYYIGLKTVENFIIRQYGGAANRMGTRFVGEVKDSTKNTMLIDFQFNEEQTYCIEFGNQYLRFIVNGGQIVEAAQNITDITQANPAVLTYAGADNFNNGDDVFLSGIKGMINLNGRSFRVANVNAGANTFELKDYQGNNISTTGYPAYTSGGTVSRIYTVTSGVPWTEDDLFELNFAQSNDVLTVVHPDYYPRDITRTGNTAWTVSLFSNSGGPFLDENVTATTVQASAATGTGITITASAALFDATMVGELFYIQQEPEDTTLAWEAAKAVNSGDVRRADTHYYEALNSATTGTIKPSHVEGSQYDGNSGVQWKYLHSGFGIVKITAYTDTTHVTADVINRLPALVVSTTTTIWKKAAWSAAQGYPAAVAYAKQRLLFGGTKQNPKGLYVSAVANRTYFGAGNPILDDEAIIMSLDTNVGNIIRHILPMADVIVLTSSSAQLIKGENRSLLASQPPDALIQSYTGSSRVRPLIIGNSGLYVQDIGSTIHTLKYQLDSDSFGGIDVTARSPHLFRNKAVKQWAYQRHPFSVVWTITDDEGDLLGFTFMEEQQVYAWHRHTTDGIFESVATLREDKETAAYFIVQRTINGVQKRYIERFASRYFSETRDAYFVDCGLTYDGRNTGSETITVTGGSTWTSAAAETLTLTASAADTFTQEDADLGNEIAFWTQDQAGNDIRLSFRITGYTSGTVVSAIALRDVPLGYQGVARTDWEFAKNRFYNLNHIDGLDVSVLADGNIVKDVMIIDGKATLPDAAAVVHIGLGYTSLLETLDMAQPGGQTKSKTLSIPVVHVTVQETLSLSVGINGFGSVKPVPQRRTSSGYDLALPAETTVFDVQTNSDWSRRGRICIKQDKPLPITITCLTPEIEMGEG